MGALGALGAAGLLAALAFLSADGVDGPGAGWIGGQPDVRQQGVQLVAGHRLAGGRLGEGFAFAMRRIKANKAGDILLFCRFELLVRLPEQFEECGVVRVLMKLLGARVARIEGVGAYITDRRPSGARRAIILTWPAAAEKQNVGWPRAARFGETAAGVCQKINQSSQL